MFEILSQRVKIIGGGNLAPRPTREESRKNISETCTVAFQKVRGCPAYDRGVEPFPDPRALSNSRQRATNTTWTRQGKAWAAMLAVTPGPGVVINNQV